MVAAIGNFDGVHLGHKYIINSACELAKAKKVPSSVYTFEPHPCKILAPESPLLLIQTTEQKIKDIEKLGVDICIVEKFTNEFAHMKPEEFFERILIKRLNVLTVIVGYDFTFGFHRVGSINDLKMLGTKHDVEIIVVEAKFLEDQLLSSTRIRNLIRDGDVKMASQMLGRPYFMEGEVVKGRGVGVSLNARTANMVSKNELIPGNGVYLTKTKVAGDKRGWLGSVTSVGTNPTFASVCGHEEVTVEVHLLDFDENIVGHELSLIFLEKMRDQLRFSSARELAEQIKIDIKDAKKRLETCPPCEPETGD